MAPNGLSVTLSPITPLVLGGAGSARQDGPSPAEFRPPSVKGLIRYWYRAIDCRFDQQTQPNGPKREDAFFGSTTTGQSPYLLRASEWRTGVHALNREDYEKCSESHGPNGLTGVLYLGYPFFMKGVRRQAIWPDSGPLELRVVGQPDRDTLEARRAWLAGLWLLSQIGGAGSRSRRAFGSLGLQGWSGWKETEALPNPSRAQTAEQWREAMEAGLHVLQSWFPYEGARKDHTEIGPGTRLLLIRTKFRTWQDAMNDAGKRLQYARRIADPFHSETMRIRRALAAHRQLERGPVTAGFGLPLAYRFQNLGTVSFSGVRFQRMASPLFVRVVRIADAYHAMFAYVPAPLPPGDLQAQAFGRVPQNPEAKTAANVFISGFRKDGLEVTL